MADSKDHKGVDDLDRRIAQAQEKHNRGASRAQDRAETQGWAVGIEFVGVVLVAGFIGWAIDNWAGLGIAPWGMITMLVLGFAAGVRRALQTSTQFGGDPSNDPKE